MDMADTDTPEPSADDKPSKSSDAVAKQAPQEEKAAPKADVAVQAPATSAVVGNGDADVVYLSRCVYKNAHARKSLTVHHLQRRLYELGYRDAYADKDGWYGDLTRASVAAYQKANNIEGDGLMDAVTFASIFAKDKNVAVNLYD